MKSGPIQVDKKEWEYAEQFLSSSKNPWSVDLFYVCPVPSLANSEAETKQHQVLAEYRSTNGFPYVTLNHEFIRAGDRLFAMPSAYEIEMHPELVNEGGQGKFSWVIPRDDLTSTQWGVKILNRKSKHEIRKEKLLLAEFATSRCVGENYPFIVRPLKNRIHYYHVQPRAPGPSFAQIKGFKSALAYYLTAISLIRIVRRLHVHKILHRDIKPDNIMLWPTVDDPYGIALVDNDPSHLHQLDGDNNIVHTNSLLGTEGYQAPERNQPTDVRFKYRFGFASDVYSLGITFIERFGISKANQGTFTESFPVRRWIGAEFQVFYEKRPRFKESPPEFAKAWLPLECLLMKMTAQNPHHRPDLTTALQELIVGMHRVFDSKELQNDSVRLTLEKCPPEVLEKARTHLKISGISLALPPLVDVFEVSKTLVPQFTGVYKPSRKEEFVSLALDVEKSLVKAMQQCMLM